MTWNLECLKQLSKPMLKINTINHRKNIKNSTINDTGLEHKLLISKDSWIIITRNLWIFGGLVNSIIDTVYDVIWEDRVNDLFVIIATVILVVVDNYTGFVNIKINGVYIVFIMPVEA